MLHVLDTRTRFGASRAGSVTSFCFAKTIIAPVQLDHFAHAPVGVFQRALLAGLRQPTASACFRGRYSESASCSAAAHPRWLCLCAALAPACLRWHAVPPRLVAFARCRLRTCALHARAALPWAASSRSSAAHRLGSVQVRVALRCFRACVLAYRACVFTAAALP